MDESLKAFFDAYARAFEARDGARIAGFYSVPCMSVRADGSLHAYRSRAEVEAFFKGVADAYHGEGMRHSEAKDLQVVPVGSQSVLATVDWFIYREDRSLIRPWRQSYNLVRADGDWRILLSTFHR